MQKLTYKQEEVLNILTKYHTENGESPTLSELQNIMLNQGLAAKSKRGVVQYLEALEKKGLITRSEQSRGIRLNNLNKEEDNFINVPILGDTSAGSATTFADENISGFLKISKKFLQTTQNIFALQVVGDSMNQCLVDHHYIEDGDYVVIDKNAHNIQNGDIVLAILDACATIKKIKKNFLGEIVLIPESINPVHQPIYIHESDNFSVNGKVINVLKSPNNM